MNRHSLRPSEDGIAKRYYRPEIDGLRAVAVILVVLFHAGLGVPGGFVGVDVFFVISGFLITGILVRQIGSGSFSFRAFWLRRLRRLFPAMAVMVAFVLLAAYRLLTPYDLRALGMASIAQVMFVANFYFARKTDYFAGSSDELPLLHTWSLAVEEQFYLLLPVLLVVLLKASGRRVIVAMTLIALGSFLLNLAWSTSHPKLAFFTLPTRAMELLIG